MYKTQVPTENPVGACVFGYFVSSNENLQKISLYISAKALYNV